MENRTTSKLAKALEIYQENRLINVTAESEAEEHVFSSKFEEKMQSMMKTRQKPYYIMINTPKRRAALIAFTLIIAMSATVVNAEALREPVANFFIQIYESFSRIIFPNEMNEDAPIIIEQYYRPEYIPKGYEIERSVEDDDLYQLIYIDENGRDLTYYQITMPSLRMMIDTEGTTTRDIQVNGNSGIFFSNKGYNNIVWDDGMYVYFISAVTELGEDELFAIAESLVEISLEN